MSAEDVEPRAADEHVVPLTAEHIVAVAADQHVVAVAPVRRRIVDLTKAVAAGEE